MSQSYSNIASYRSSNHFWFLPALIFTVLAFFPQDNFSQQNLASPSNWLYPDGNMQGTKNIFLPSDKQSLDSFKIKWSTPDISGDVKPLIGNIINNPKLGPSFKWAPNEMAAVVSGEIITIDASGRTGKKSSLPPYVKSISVLFDTLRPEIIPVVPGQVVLGLETIEVENLKDSLAYAYICGFDHGIDTIGILKRLAIDLRDYKPNIFASIKPVFGRKEGNDFLVYATVNMTKPTITANPGPTPFFRGFTQFNTGNIISTFPLPDVGDDVNSRITLGPEVDFSQPSYSKPGGNAQLLLPTYPSPTITETLNNIVTDPTSADIPYLLGFDISNASISEGIYPRPLTQQVDPAGSRPVIKSYFIDIKDKQTGDSLFILVAEEYNGIDGSTGNARLHLYDAFGDPITLPGDNIAPPLYGGKNHHWSVAVGDVDGDTSNSSLPFFPNNEGNELIVTQSSRDFAVAGSKLYFMRYYSGNEIDKPSPPNSYLFHFDTIASKRINGWVAAVNDLDAAPDKKSEIVLVDGSRLMVVRLRDYDSYEFRIGEPIDTLFTHTFTNQTISSVAISDLEGDGLNDLIVTTYDSTYVIGSVLKDILIVDYPKAPQNPPEEFCAGDSIFFQWRNLVRGQDKAMLLFKPYENGIPVSDTLITVRRNIANDADTVNYAYVVDSTILGYTGQFIVQSEYSYSIYDTSSVMKFNEPTLSLLPLAYTEYYSGSDIDIDFIGTCLDSAALEYSYDSTNWVRLNTEPIFSGPSGTFTLSAELPCGNFYQCLGMDSDSIIYMQVINYRYVYADTSDIFSILLRPAQFPVEYDTNSVACPSKLFTWDVNDIEFTCDTVSISLSANGGMSWTYITSVPASDGEYLWYVPTELPDELIVRFCCENSCVRTDTLINNYKAKYIDIVAPNPFRPPYEELSVVYKVPTETNVTIRIYDQYNRLVAEPVRNQARSPGTAYCDRWNGETRNGIPAANGMYYLSLELSGGAKEIYHVFVRK